MLVTFDPIVTLAREVQLMKQLFGMVVMESGRVTASREEHP